MRALLLQEPKDLGHHLPKDLGWLSVKNAVNQGIMPSRAKCLQMVLPVAPPPLTPAPALLLQEVEALDASKLRSLFMMKGKRRI